MLRRPCTGTVYDAYTGVYWRSTVLLAMRIHCRYSADAYTGVYWRCVYSAGIRRGVQCFDEAPDHRGEAAQKRSPVWWEWPVRLRGATEHQEYSHKCGSLYLRSTDSTGFACNRPATPPFACDSSFRMRLVHSTSPGTESPRAGEPRKGLGKCGCLFTVNQLDGLGRTRSQTSLPKGTLLSLPRGTSKPEMHS